MERSSWRAACASVSASPTRMRRIIAQTPLKDRSNHPNFNHQLLLCHVPGRSKQCYLIHLKRISRSYCTGQPHLEVQGIILVQQPLAPLLLVGHLQADGPHALCTRSEQRQASAAQGYQLHRPAACPLSSPVPGRARPI